jgi:proteic killer suppression protein
LIASYANSETQKLAPGERVKKFGAIARMARRKLAVLQAAVSLEDLTTPPGNRLEALARDRKGQHSIRINDQHRIWLIWKDANAREVEIVDYH